MDLLLDVRRYTEIVLCSPNRRCSDVVNLRPLGNGDRDKVNKFDQILSE